MSRTTSSTNNVQLWPEITCFTLIKKTKMPLAVIAFLNYCWIIYTIFCNNLICIQKMNSHIYMSKRFSQVRNTNLLPYNLECWCESNLIHRKWSCISNVDKNKLFNPVDVITFKEFVLKALQVKKHMNYVASDELKFQKLRVHEQRSPA